MTRFSFTKAPSWLRRGFVAAALLAPLAVLSARAEQAVIIPEPAVDQASAEGIQTAVLAGGCFWGIQGVFQHVDGVVRAVSGYAGGAKETAKYELTHDGRSGHAEAVEIKFDPKKITYGKLLQIYFSVAHDPTQLNRQEPDEGPQYRSTIFAASDDQKRVAEAYIAQLNAAKVYRKPIATTIEMGKPFYEGEAYHQDYMTLNPYQPYIVRYDLPKVENLKKVFASLYRAKPVLVRDAKVTTN